MPNWVENNINADKEVITDIVKRFVNDKGDFDFNYLIPMPKTLDVTKGSTNDTDIYYYLSERNTLPVEAVKANPDTAKLIDNMFSLDFIGEIAKEVAIRVAEGKLPDYNAGKQLVDNYHKYGAMTWYEWCYDNWNTKWNACDTSIEDEAIRFSTAWDIPEPILKKLCMIYPNKSIGIYCEEETGWFKEYENINGELVLIDEGENSYEDEEEEGEVI